MLTNKEKGTILKAGLALGGLVVVGPYIVGAVAIAILLVVGVIGIAAGLADWFLRYGLQTLGVFVVFVLVLRWLFGPARRRAVAPLEIPDLPTPTPHDDERLALDAELEIARIKAEMEKDSGGGS